MRRSPILFSMDGEIPIAAGPTLDGPISTRKPPNDAVAEQPAPSKIRAFSQALGGHGGAGENWKRTPNATGTGAAHMKSFHCKLNAESLEFLDKQINEWLDAHPEYEVKLVTTSVGEWQGKVREPNLIVQVWV